MNKEKINFSENRNVYMPNKKMKKILLKSIKTVFEYPDYKNIEVNKSISKYFDIQEKNLMVTNGSLEGINLLVNALKKEESTLFIPTFWGYEDALNRYGYTVHKELLMDEMNYNIEEISNKAKSSKLIILCNPNNPTLSYISKYDLIKIIKDNPKCHFIIDETMLIFDDKFNNKTVCREVNKYKNLSVVISFSKFLGIAGLRTGVLFSNEIVINKTKKISIPYSFGKIQQNIIPISLGSEEYLNKTKKLIMLNRKKLCKDLIKLGCFIIDGNTNFILVKLPENIDANSLTEYLYNNGIEVRNIKESYPQLSGDWIRISINTKSNNKILVKTIDSYINNKKRR